MFQPEKYPLEGLTDEGKKMMEFVFEDMNSQNNKSFGQRFSEMSANFTTNLFQDLAVIFMVVTNNQTMKNTYTELHSMLGTTERFSAMSNKELFFMIKNRLVIDTVILAFVIFTVLV